LVGRGFYVLRTDVKLKRKRKKTARWKREGKKGSHTCEGRGRLNLFSRKETGKTGGTSETAFLI